MRRIMAAAAACTLAATTVTMVFHAPPTAAQSAADRYHAVAETPMAMTYTGSVPFTVEPDHEGRGELPNPGPNTPPIVPASAHAIMLRLSATGSSSVGGVLTVHPCSRSADPQIDGVARLSPDAGQYAEVIVPWDGVAVCFGTTGNAFVNVTPRIIGYVDTDPAGSAWVDLPDVTILKVDVPANSVIVPRRAAVDLATSGVPPDATAVGLWAFGTGLDGASLIFSATCGAGVIASVGNGNAIATPLWIPVSEMACVSAILSGGKLTVQIAGYYRPIGDGSPLGPPQIRFRPTHAPLFTPVTPQRLLDTRDHGARLVADTPFTLDLDDVPDRATAVALNVTVTEPTASGFVTAWPCSSAQPLASSLNYTAGQTVANSVIVSTGTDHSICFASHADAHLLVDLSGWYEEGTGDGYVPQRPQRAFDTRETLGPVAAGEPREFDLSALVAADASAVVLNLTVTDPVSDGFVTAYPCGTAPPLASNVNVARGATVANLVTVALPADHRLCVFTNVGTHLVGDVSGWYAPSSVSGFVDVNPDRLFDTRDEGGPQPSGASSYLEFRTTQDAWVMNVTVTEGTAPGYLSVYPCGQLPLVSNLNYVAGQTVPNLVIGAPSERNQVCFYTHGRTHVVADLQGWFTSNVFVVGYQPEGFDQG